MNSMSHALGEEENRKEGGKANFRLECRRIRSAGKNDKGGGFGNLGGVGGRCEVGPFTQSRKVMAPAECRQGVGLGAQFLNGWLARPGPRSPLGNLHSQEQSVFHQNRKNHRRKMHM